MERAVQIDFGKSTGRATGDLDLELNGDVTSKSLLRNWRVNERKRKHIIAKPHPSAALMHHTWPVGQSMENPE